MDTVRRNRRGATWIVSGAIGTFLLIVGCVFAVFVLFFFFQRGAEGYAAVRQ